jgi:hypothetical protein
MPFDQSTLLSVKAAPHGAQWMVSWTSSSPAGTWWQIYVGQRLAWSGQETNVMLPTPGRSTVNIGAVLPSEIHTWFGMDLPIPPARRALLTWQGGLFEGQDLLSYNIYQATAPGQAVSLTTPIDNITAFPQGAKTGGYGRGGYGSGGYGSAASSFSWTSGILANGSWQFAVAPLDQAGNMGTAVYTGLVITGPPQEPPPFPDTSRLHYSFNLASETATLTWNPSSA